MRPLWLALGCATLALVWLGPLHVLLPGHFSAHMAMHMGVVALAAPALCFAVMGGRFDPVRRAPRLFAPLPASVVELIAVWVWHTPGLHRWAREAPLGFVLEQLSFLFSGLWVWLAAFGGDAALRAERGAQGGVALLLTSMHMTLLGALLALPPRPLYTHVASAHAAHQTLSALDDQHLGGAIMLVFGGVVYLTGGLVLTVQLLRRMPARGTP